MKIKIIILAVALCACVSASAQKGEKRIGLSAGFSSELGIKYPQIGVSYAYNFTDRLGLMPSFDYYFYRFKETKFQMYDISVDARYSLFTGDKFDAYPILGIAVSHTNGFEIGANLGAGVDYELSRKIDLIFNVKYQFAKYYNQALFTIGAGYKF